MVEFAEVFRISLGLILHGDSQLWEVVLLSLKVSLLAVLAAADLFIGPSTGPLHLAAALGVPTLGLYPPVRTMHPDRWGPRSFVNPAPRNLMPELDCPARRLCRLERCEHYNCLNELRVEAVLTAAREILGPELPLRHPPLEDGS